MIVSLGTRTSWGKVVAIGWVGERYYWMIDGRGCISMMPAFMVENEVAAMSAQIGKEIP